MTIKLANTKDIPEGKAIVVRIQDGTELALFKIEGKIYALENVCPHMGGPLAEGEIENCKVTCPWHGWQFNIKDGACENMPGEDAKSYKIKVIEDEVFLDQNS